MSLTDSKHLYYELLRWLWGVPWMEVGVGVWERSSSRGSWLERPGDRGREGRRWQEKPKFKVDELFTAGNNPGLTYSPSEHPKL